MDSRFSWHRCSYCFRVITIVVILVAIFSGYAGAQEVPSAGSPETAPSDSERNCSDFSLCQLHFSDLKLGIFGGGGTMSVHRNIAAGPASLALLGGGSGPAFPGFNHHSITRLDDGFVGGEWGFRWGDILEGTTSFDTNFGIQNRFRQTSAASPGQTGIGGNPALGVLFLPDNTKGVITLDNKNRIFNVDQCFAFPKEIKVLASPLVPKLRFLAGWKYSQISNNLDPYSAAIPILSFQTLPGTANWGNFWMDSAVPSAVSFTMTQRLWWTGPYLGVRLTGRTPKKLPVQWYVEGKGTPYVWGNYIFKWEGFYDDNPFFVRGQQTTDMAVHGYFLEVKGGAEIKLIGRLFLDVWSKYSYLHMQGSGHEVQSSQNNFLATPSLLQNADQNISINENFWAVGANLVLQF